MKKKNSQNAKPPETFRPPETVVTSREEYFKLREDNVFSEVQKKLFGWITAIFTFLSILGVLGANYIVNITVDNAVEDTKKKVSVENIAREVKEESLKDMDEKKKEIFAKMEKEFEDFRNEMDRKKKELKGEVMSEVEEKMTFWISKLGPGKDG